MTTQSKDIRIDLDSKIWGPKGWFFIDSIVLSYPLNPTKIEKDQYKNFFYTFPIILPCAKCRVHFNEYIIKYPLNDQILSSKNIKKDNCVSTCGLKQINNHYKQRNNYEQTFKLLSIILFGVIISLSLYILRSMQLKNNMKK